MDMTPTTTTTTPKSPEPESETPTRIQPAKPISFSNGIIKRHHLHHHHHHHHHPVVPITYKECLKNHAAALGGHALDGCGEFMPSPSSNLSDPTSLKCAACGCHRNFHRRDPDDSSPTSGAAVVAALPSPHPSSAAAAIEYQPHHRHHPPPPAPPPPPGHSRSPNSASPPPISSSYMLLALSGTNANTGNSLAFSDLNFSGNNLSTHQTPGSRKRFRTKFSPYQKEKMQEFAERVGWKMQKRDEEEIRDFCREIGVDKSVLKVWMHNNKNNFNRRDPFSGITGGARRSDNGGSNHSPVAPTETNNNNNNNSNSNTEEYNRDGNGGGGGGGGGEGRGLTHDLHHGGGEGGGFESDSGGAHGGNANGSSSSS